MADVSAFFHLETLGSASRQNLPCGLLFSDLLRVSNDVSQTFLFRANL
jgi:hypothetical protein